MIKRRRFEEGETILTEGDIGETAYVIVTGSVEVIQGTGDELLELGTLGPGDIFGEMSMIDDKPRSATVIARARTTVHEIHQDDFFEKLQTDPEAVLRLLTGLFERLRECEARLNELQFQRPVPAPPEPDESARKRPIVLLDGLTPDALEALPSSPFEITKFPFRIGRHSHNPLVHNDLELEDEMPWQISRHHVAIVYEEGRIGIRDRGSRMGTEVDGTRIGGKRGDPGPIFLERAIGELCLGQEHSPFRFKLIVER